MTGPAYPRPPTSSGIGSSFEIGVSPIGTIPPFDIWRTIISQYGNSDRMTAAIETFADCVDQTQNLDNFYDLMWNVRTAQGYGLDCWGTIVAVNRVLHISAGPKYLGFDEGGMLDYDPFNTSPWYSGQKLTDNYVLTDDGFRTLIFAKALSNICDGSIRAINQILTILFGSLFHSAWCTDEGGMAMTYTFNYTLNPVEEAIVTNSGVLPTPTGVSYSIVTPS